MSPYIVCVASCGLLDLGNESSTSGHSAMPFVRLRWLNSLSMKVLLAFIAGVVLSIVLIVLAAFLIVRSQGDVLSGKAVAERTQDLAGKLRFDSAGIPTGFDDPIEGAFDDMDDSWQQESLKSETAYRVLDASG